MGRLGLTGGDYMLAARVVAGASRSSVRTEWGEVTLLDGGECVALQRHGLDRYRAPHAIPHAANLSALAVAGCDRVLGIGSVGGLRPELDVGTFLAPDDFIALHLGGSPYDDRRGHGVPGFDPRLRERVVAAWDDGGAASLRDGGTYWEAIGPRFETPAEIRMIAAHADVVGMTVASECVAATQAGLPYAAVCVVDNLANGVGEQRLSLERFEAGRAANRERVAASIDALVAALAGNDG